MRASLQEPAPSHVMAGLDPAIHVFECRQKRVDARIKSGHDDSMLRDWRSPFPADRRRVIHA
jgi:hypothetical protein